MLNVGTETNISNSALPDAYMLPKGKILHHGSVTKWDKLGFDPAKNKMGLNWMGSGFYSAENPELAKYYSLHSVNFGKEREKNPLLKPNPHHLTVRTEKAIPLLDLEKPMSTEVASAFESILNAHGAPNWLNPDWRTAPARVAHSHMSPNLGPGFEGLMGEKFHAKLSQMGYQGLTWMDKPDLPFVDLQKNEALEGGSRAFSVFNPEPNLKILKQEQHLDDLRSARPDKIFHKVSNTEEVMGDIKEINLSSSAKPVANILKNIEHKKTFAAIGVASVLTIGEATHLLHKRQRSAARNGPQTKSNSSRGGIAYL